MSEILSTSARLRQLLPELFQQSALEGERYLRYQLTSEISALMTMNHVRESQLIERDQITPLPKMLPFVMGLCSSRERVFMVLDFAQLLTLPSALATARRYHVIVVNVGEFTEQNNDQELWVGLAVEKIQGILRINEQKLNLDDNLLTKINPQIMPYVENILVDHQVILPILDLAKIITSGQITL